MPKLTKTVVDNAKAPEKGDEWWWDTEVPGFGLRVQASGRKTYVVRYRNASHTQRKMTIGRACDMTPDKARDLARKVFTAVAEGRDPAVEREEARSAPTTQDLRDRFMKEHAIPFKKPRSAALDETNWRLHVLPKHAGKKVAEWTKADVVKLQAELAKTPALANQIVALLGKAFNLAEDWGWRPQNSNPCRRLKKFRLKTRDLILSVPDTAAVDQACTELTSAGELDLPMAALARLWMITGCRNSEIRTARREWVSFDLKALLLPDSKVGQREIPLPDAALDIVRELDAVYGAGREWLIPGRLAGEPLKSPWKRWKKIAARAGVSTRSTPHTLRHTVGSIGHRAAGLSQKQIAMQLGHRQMSTTERYIHGEQSEQAQVATKIANVITGGWKRETEAA
jgi:integrase